MIVEWLSGANIDGSSEVYAQVELTQANAFVFSGPRAGELEHAMSAYTTTLKGEFRREPAPREVIDYLFKRTQHGREGRYRVTLEQP